MNKQSAGVHEFGTVLKPLIMALGLDVGKVPMTGTQDVTTSDMVNHQTHDHLKFEGIYSGNLQVKVLPKQNYVHTYTLIQYWSNLNLVSEVQYLELPEKSDSKISKNVKFDTWNNSTTATVFWGNGILTISLHYLQTTLALINDELLCLVLEILS